MKKTLATAILLSLVSAAAHADTPQDSRAGNAYTAALNTLEASGYAQITDLSMHGGLVYARATKNNGPVMVVVDPAAKKIIRESKRAK